LNRMMSKFAALLLFAGPQQVLGDLPVHCLRHQLLGEWSFQLGALTPQRSSCGHQRPDNQDVQPSGVDSVASEKRVTLLDPNTATTAHDTSGSFTMIYDEAFEVKVENFTFLAFSRFELLGSPDSASKRNVSHCGETARGWYRDAARTGWGCYFARKVHQPVSLLYIAPEVPQPSADYDEPHALSYHQERVKQLNARESRWTARVYKRFIGLSLRQLNSYAGIQRANPSETASVPLLAEARQRRHAALLLETSKDCPASTPLRRPKQGDVLPHLLLRGQTGQKPCQLRRQAEIYSHPIDAATIQVEKQMPKSFDWRSHNGQNFLEPVMDQGDCGSCYIVSTMRMLTARHKIRTNNTKAEPWSISFPLHCSEYNQGCKGGYGFLASKWSEDVGLLPASCAPYQTQGRCEVKCDTKKLGKRYRAGNHRYIGGFYGNSSTASIMQEVYKNGPVVVSFEPTDDFMYYAGGIFAQQKLGVPAPLRLHASEWQQVDHAVLAVGWGEEMGQKYWIVQNSWGDTWGEDGFFRIARDINDSGVESIAVAADVVEDDHPEVLESFVAQTATQPTSSPSDVI